MIKLETFMSHKVRNESSQWMSSKPTRPSRFSLLELFFMRLPSSSSLVLASLVVSSSSSSSPSALAAPVGDGPEDSSSYAPAAVLLAQHAPNPPSSDDTLQRYRSTAKSCGQSYWIFH